MWIDTAETNGAPPRLASCYFHGRATCAGTNFSLHKFARLVVFSGFVDSDTIPQHKAPRSERVARVPGSQGHDVCPSIVTVV